jgi:hypothetical protein
MIFLAGSLSAYQVPQIFAGDAVKTSNFVQRYDRDDNLVEEEDDSLYCTTIDYLSSSCASDRQESSKAVWWSRPLVFILAFLEKTFTLRIGTTDLFHPLCAV